MSLPERGKRIPDTRESFERLAALYENALIIAKEENSRLRAEINELKQKMKTSRSCG